MALFLIPIGGAIVLEVSRALNGGNKNVAELKRREGELRRQLQDIQKDLERTRKERELTVQEAAQLSAVNERLAAEKEQLGRQARSLQEENEVLAAQADRLLQRQEMLEQCAESLKAENSALIQQFDRLKIKYEAESASFQEQLAALKADVTAGLSRFTSGEISADQLIAFLSDMGVELRVSQAAGLEGLLPDQLNSARSRDERLKLMDKVEISVDDNWVQKMRLTSAEPGRAALLMAGAQRGADPSGPSLPALAYAPAAKLDTPPKERTAASLPAIKVPPLKLAGPAAAPAAAAPADENVDAAQQQLAAAAAQAPAAKPAAAKGGKSGGSKKPYLTFLPTAKRASKKAPPTTSPRLQLDLPLSGGGGGAKPRLPFDAAQDEMMDMAGSKSMVAL